MSLEAPNKNETLIENYAAAVRRYNKAKLAVEAATRELEAAQTHRQSAWGFVKEEIGTQQGKIQPGVYRLQKDITMYAEAVLIQPHHDYPEIFPMFR